ncbi:MAG TPA: NAD(P)(+) transhydrogenase (Re/Si-specific) subunit beta [Gemmatimonadales bacterium]|jgi:NAD(P) transhydrogenase subunit beta|nr:NAD(P)(+) transhydrogenase (Re/Si-specific) subunit beta [Gemmatimonadales bacterium]
MPVRELAIQVIYLASSVFFILGLRGLSGPEKARAGMAQAAFGMLLAIIGTLLHQDIVRFDWIVAGLVIGSFIGIVIGRPLFISVPMTAMPQWVALSHAAGAVAATLVGVNEYLQLGALAPRGTMAALGFEVFLGALTVTGSVMAFGKLQEILPGRPVTWPLQNFGNLLLLAAALGLIVVLVVNPGFSTAFWILTGLAAALGVLMVLPIGGADMPVVISLLNAYAGLSASAMGFAIDNNLLIIVGALDGTSGLLLSILMCRAMNRSFTNVLFGAFGAKVTASGKPTEGQEMRAITPDDAAVRLAYAGLVIVVPGYGLAVAQAQHALRELTEQLEKRGVEVKYAIHPVAGRMPGHMNVLLAEANVPYDKLFDMDEINADFNRCDVALVIGANDVVNPAARSDPASPIYGMPILDVDRARSVIVLKRGKGAGFAGIENELFFNPKTAMLFGDAKASLSRLVTELKAL